MNDETTRCALCPRTAIDAVFECEKRVDGKEVASTCPKCGKVWTVRRDAEVSIVPPPAPASSTPSTSGA
tara:strand:+ start:8387 stop:8593 length:207 start_codon:yes stop_codon:yes gene_type:complete